MPNGAECPEKAKLIASTQAILERIARLATEQREALANEAENLVRTIDERIEHELGAKERALGALRQHRSEHGC